jgi:hypothetical protein
LYVRLRFEPQGEHFPGQKPSTGSRQVFAAASIVETPGDRAPRRARKTVPGVRSSGRIVAAPYEALVGAPLGNCQRDRQWTGYGWRNVEVCD